MHIVFICIVFQQCVIVLNDAVAYIPAQYKAYTHTIVLHIVVCFYDFGIASLASGATGSVLSEWRNI